MYLGSAASGAVYTCFLEKPFQGCTRGSADLLGTVTFHCVYRVPVAAVRAELERILAVTDLWDGKASGLVVVDATDKTVILRALVSAKNFGGVGACAVMYAKSWLNSCSAIIRIACRGYVPK